MFDRLATIASRQGGSAWFFVANLVITLVWLAFGPYFEWSMAWQTPLVTYQTIATFFLAILIQNSGIRDTNEIKADQKAQLAELRELIRAIPGAREAA